MNGDTFSTGDEQVLTHLGQFFRVLSPAAIQNGGRAGRGHNDFPHVWTQSQHRRQHVQVDRFLMADQATNRQELGQVSAMAIYH
jgi:hypothetical protein